MTGTQHPTPRRRCHSAHPGGGGRAVLHGNRVAQAAHSVPKVQQSCCSLHSGQALIARSGRRCVQQQRLWFGRGARARTPGVEAVRSCTVVKSNGLYTASCRPSCPALACSLCIHTCVVTCLLEGLSGRGAHGSPRAWKLCGSARWSSRTGRTQRPAGPATGAGSAPSPPSAFLRPALGLVRALGAPARAAGPPQGPGWCSGSAGRAGPSAHRCVSTWRMQGACAAACTAVGLGCIQDPRLGGRKSGLTCLFTS